MDLWSFSAAASMAWDACAEMIKKCLAQSGSRKLLFTARRVVKAANEIIGGNCCVVLEQEEDKSTDKTNRQNRPSLR